AREYETGLHAAKDLVERGVVAGLKGICRSDGRVKHTGVHRGERQQSVLDAVAGQNHDRSVLRQPAVEEGLPDAPHASERLRIRETGPRAFRLPLGQEQGIWGRLRPVLEPFGYFFRVRPERSRGREIGHAGRTATDEHISREHVDGLRPPSHGFDHLHEGPAIISACNSIPLLRSFWRSCGRLACRLYTSRPWRRRATGFGRTRGTCRAF